MSLIQQLTPLGVEDGAISYGDLGDAIEWAEEQDGLVHQQVLTVYRESSSSMDGDEIEHTGFTTDVASGEVCFYWCENAGGMAFAAFSSGPVQLIGTWLAKLMDELGFTFYQFVNCELLNHAPKILSRQAVYRVVEEALARGDADEDDRLLPEWFAAQYEEATDRYEE